MKRKLKQTRKAAFTILGRIESITKMVNGQEVPRKAFIPDSPAHLQSELAGMNNGPCAITFETKIPTRSESQLAYHMVLMGYIARHTGYSKSEVHDAVMRAKFGTKRIQIGTIIEHVRRSVGEWARFPLDDMAELISYDLEICEDLDIRVPTKAELGYIDV